MRDVLRQFVYSVVEANHPKLDRWFCLLMGILGSHAIGTQPFVMSAIGYSVAGLLSRRVLACCSLATGHPSEIAALAAAAFGAFGVVVVVVVDDDRRRRCSCLLSVLRTALVHSGCKHHLLYPA